MADKPEKRVKVPGPTGQLVDGSEVSVAESIEKWSEFTLDDGTVIRVKPNVMSAIRIDGQYDPEGNPMYGVKANHIVLIVSSPDRLRKASKDSKVQ